MKKKVKLLVAGAMLVLFSGGVYLELSAQRWGEVGWKKDNGQHCCLGTGDCYVSEAGNC
ncbi:hypothetical protein [Belliella pelovolcani]|uniref:Uncharacterized protein n=1 Tax=Belliella pelovolcani TaxID=529505 RepID=A0A1N7N348_9BACT|nr:hypothetical protein [Belliella pelovolcani]SIS92772.1 hypothetical protein SAMN05421761_108118 [Belliella pelovolcani]